MTTILGIPPPTEAEKVELQRWHRHQWIERIVPVLVALAKEDARLAKRLAREFKRVGAPAPKRQRWSHGDHIWLVTTYLVGLDRSRPRGDLLERLARVCGLKDLQSVENRLSKALNDVDLSELPEFLQLEFLALRTNRPSRGW